MSKAVISAVASRIIKKSNRLNVVTLLIDYGFSHLWNGPANNSWQDIAVDTKQNTCVSPNNVPVNNCLGLTKVHVSTFYSS